MTIIEYLAKRQIRPVNFAASVGVHESTVSRWARGLGRPSLASLVKIEQATGGKIKIIDFFPAPNGAAK